MNNTDSEWYGNGCKYDEDCGTRAQLVMEPIEESPFILIGGSTMTINELQEKKFTKLFNQ